MPAMLDVSHIQKTSERLNGYGRVHPNSNGRVIVLDEIPQQMDLRGIAGIVCKRTKNPEIAAYINARSPEELKELRSNEALFDGHSLIQRPGNGPHRPAAFNLPAIIEKEVAELAKIFHDVTNAKTSRIWFPSAPATTFHVDGSQTNSPQWRMTFALNGDQTIFHNYQRDENTPMQRAMGLSYPVIPEDRIGTFGTDSFAAEGALIFLWNSKNALFHRTPDKQAENRFVVTIDANAPRQLNCQQNCPFPCR